MSYDLSFLRRGQPPLSIDEFREYFAARPHFTVEETQARYQSDKTGVHFVFEHGSPFDPEELSELNLPDDLVDAHVAFNLCYWRPHVFGLEAEPEVARFVERFDLEVLDEQQPDEGHVYSAGRFLEGWNEGNEAGYQVGAAVHPDAPTLPTSEIRRCWEWNRCVIERQASSLGERVFVAKIAFLREGASYEATQPGRTRCLFCCHAWTLLHCL